MKPIDTELRDYNYPRMLDTDISNAFQGYISWSPIRSLWITTMALIAIIGGYFTVSIETISVFLVTTGITICFGHSLGMHRLFIHHSFECPKWLEHLLVYLGVLVGLAGPISMMQTHDLRDWAQRQQKSHPYFGHKTYLLQDAFWQMHCNITLENPPVFQPETQVINDQFYLFIEKFWMCQQLPLALLLVTIGGIDWVIWGICMRVFISVSGHWLIGYFAHTSGHREWYIKGASVQGYNIKFCGLMTMGECWHNNHHAYPGSALLGINSNQTDPGWWMLVLMNKVGLVWNIKTPKDLPIRNELVPFVQL